MKSCGPPIPLPLRREYEQAIVELKRFDAKLDLWWQERRGCWSVVEFLNRSGVWSHTFDWKGPSGEYRRLLPVSHITARLQECDWQKYADRFGMGEGFQAAVENDMGSERRGSLGRRRVAIEELRTDQVKVMSRAKDFHLETGGTKRRAYEEAREESRQNVAEVLGNG